MGSVHAEADFEALLFGHVAAEDIDAVSAG
jgi:hypothetical protein